MSALSRLLEEFGAPAAASAASVPAPGSAPDPDALEEARLAGFEAGFRAGWDDATAALGDADDGARAAALARFQDISFAHHEARSTLLARIGPLLEAMLARILPDLARETLGAAVLEALLSPVRAATAAPPALHLHPDDLRAVEAFLASAGAPALRLVPDVGLDRGEAVLAPADDDAEAFAIEGEGMVATMLAQLRDALATAAAPAVAAHPAAGPRSALPSTAPSAPSSVPPATERAAHG